MKSSREERLQARLRQAWVEARTLVAERMRVLEAAVSAANLGALGQEQRSSAIAAAHKLAGSLGVFGLREASFCARNIEEQFHAGCRDAGTLARMVQRLQQQLRKYEDAGQD